MKEKIADAISKVNDKYINEANNYQPKSKIRYIGMIGMVAAACLCLVVGLAVMKNNKAKDVVAITGDESVVLIDINPSIELKVNKQNKVVSVTALNDDANIVLNNMNLKNVDLDVAMNAIIGSLLKNGYLDKVYNAVNVCVEDNDTTRANELGEKISSEISGLFDANDLIGGVNTQICTTDEEIKKLAEEYGVSVGKMRLAKKVSENMGMALEVAVELSIAELWDLADEEGLEIITKEEALNLAIADANVEADSVELISNVIKEKANTFVYFIEFKVGENTIYKYKINATDGFVIEGEYTYVSEEDAEEGTEEDTNAGEEPTEGETESTTDSATEESTTAPSEPLRHITKKEALKAAVSDAGVELAAITLDELKHRVREKEYYIEFSVGTFDYTYVVSAVDGSIISKEVSETAAGEETEILTPNEALKIALEKAGVEFDDIRKCDIKYTNKKNGAEYKVHFHVGREHFEYTINAITGEIVEKQAPQGPGNNDVQTPQGPGNNDVQTPQGPAQDNHTKPGVATGHAGKNDSKVTITFEDPTLDATVI